MQTAMKTGLVAVSGVLALLLTPMAFAHGLDGHHAPFMTLLQHVFVEHGYLLVLPITLGIAWYARHALGLRDWRVRLRRTRAARFLK